jgi:hypothetical protein
VSQSCDDLFFFFPDFLFQLVEMKKNMLAPRQKQRTHLRLGIPHGLADNGDNVRKSSRNLLTGPKEGKKIGVSKRTLWILACLSEHCAKREKRRHQRLQGLLKGVPSPFCCCCGLLFIPEEQRRSNQRECPKRRSWSAYCISD